MQNPSGSTERSLAPEHQQRMRKQTREAGEVLELSIEELEERIAPGNRMN